MKHIYTLILLSISLSCNNHAPKIIGKTERENEPAIYQVEAGDMAMNNAIEQARKTLDTFKKALQSQDTNYSSFELKQAFVKPDGGNEHIWIDDIKLKDGKYIGIVSNKPDRTTEVKEGDTVEVKNDKISDWMFLENGKLRGGYTIRVLRNAMSPAEKKQFEKESGLIIED
jgi:uncharacterized protein YegJ (DUF2314 family)